jgi:opacity protein-like surface antigen
VDCCHEVIETPFQARDGIIMKTAVRTLLALLPLVVAMPAMAQYAGPGWSHSEDTYWQNSLEYHPFRFHIDGGWTITQRTSADELDNGWNTGAGFTWYPTSCLPVGLRFDGSYNQFDARKGLLNQATATYQTRVDNGTIRMWGGDADLEIDFRLGPSARMYLLGGVGWYKEQFTFRQVQFTNATFCGWWGCSPGYVGVDAIVGRNTSQWHFAKNFGIGLEFGIGGRASFFVDARYMRVDPSNRKTDFLPIRAGLRF